VRDRDERATARTIEAEASHLDDRIFFFFYTKHDYSSFVESSLSKISNSQKCNTHEETSGTSSFLQYDSRYICFFFSHALGRSVPLSPIDGEDPLSDINKERGFLPLLLLMAYYDKSHGEHMLKNNRINVLTCVMQSATCLKRVVLFLLNSC